MRQPTVDHVYQNHHLDSTRWEGYSPREGDIVVTTSYKAGTTFTQNVLLHMLHGRSDPLPTLEISPWIDARFMPYTTEQMYQLIEAQTHRRSLKSHLPLDGLPYYPEVKYLIVARDPRDIFMSLVNHYANYTETAYGAFNGGDRVGEPMPQYSGDLHDLWRQWMSGGWFDWESEGYPFWGNMYHAQSYWNFLELPNFLFVHYADMLSDLDASVRRIAQFIEHPVSDADVARIVDANTFGNVKKKAIEADANADPDAPQFFEGGQTSFIYKGTNGRWKDVLSADELGLYEVAKARVLTDDCAQWLECGGQI